ncbi:hypothetical protein [Algoriphagus boritolerans]|uniref:Por secretion system C-terminal sorting domain-containing protein n=1 Tax=Algoriphagus boritolerans DSM 17298 = JCM 18970 TaxID=1120964 RepID=A0A1H5TXL1_9BACT|nr:hypothetical protein [Algoriphagus boritolerans]SEF67574.1 hypothetical protein SAMN03080598_00997 [Algoriphagus boritolerans DSM 17298 = JCM 18970]
MKTLFTFALAGALSFSSLAANVADDLMALSNVKANFKKVNILLKGGVGEAKVSLFDQSGKKLHQRKVNVRNGDMIIPYNLNDMPCGEYKIKIATEEEEVVYTVATFEKPTPISELPLMAYGKMVDEHTVNLAVIGLSEPGVEVEIRHEGTKKLIHQEEITTPEGFRKNYKLQGVSPEDVYIYVKDANGRSKTLYFE